MDIQHIHHLYLQCSSVTIDTRKIEANSFFIAIKGERFDANTFANEALQKGASYVLIDNQNYYIDHRTILVEDTLMALQELAKFHRNFLKLPIIALTGSNGKTTTKELIATVLSKKFSVKATLGNLNNHIGVPLTLLSFDKSTAIGIVEMGANHQQEIAFLCTIAQPDYGYITNFGKAHLEGFGGVAGVIKGKSEMYQYLSNTSKKVFVNLDDPIQNEKTVALDRITFSQIDNQATLFIQSISANPLVTVTFDAITIHSHLIGLYNANNINAAATIGKYFGVSDAQIKQAIESYIPENNRSQLINKGSNEIILDAYNANPSSMKVALENFIQLAKPQKWVILGDMFELGDDSLAEHQAIVNQLLQEEAITAVFIGNDFYTNKVARANFYFFKQFEEFSSFIASMPMNDRTILIKGSRGMALERCLEFIT